MAFISTTTFKVTEFEVSDSDNTKYDSCSGEKSFNKQTFIKLPLSNRILLVRISKFLCIEVGRKVEEIIDKSVLKFSGELL
jgi:hypothetical protein